MVSTRQDYKAWDAGFTVDIKIPLIKNKSEDYSIGKIWNFEIWYIIIQFDSTKMTTRKGFSWISLNLPHNIRDIALQKTIYFLAP